MKIIICGGRLFDDMEMLERAVASFRRRFHTPITEVVSGAATGADRLGERWAERTFTPVKRFPPDWQQWGRAGGPIRNGEMARYAQGCIALPGGIGTVDMVRQAKARNLRLLDWSDGEPRRTE